MRWKLRREKTKEHDKSDEIFIRRLDEMEATRHTTTHTHALKHSIGVYSVIRLHYTKARLTLAPKQVVEESEAQVPTTSTGKNEKGFLEFDWAVFAVACMMCGVC